MNVSPSPPPPNAPAAVPDARPSGPSILLALLATLIVSGVSVGTLLYHSIMEPHPNRVLIVRADSDWEEVELTVSGGPLTSPLIIPIGKLGQYTVPFFLWPGKYTLLAQSDGIEIFTTTVDLTEDASVEFDLTGIGEEMLPTTPATLPATSTTLPLPSQ